MVIRRRVKGDVACPLRVCIHLSNPSLLYTCLIFLFLLFTSVVKYTRLLIGIYLKLFSSVKLLPMYFVCASMTWFLRGAAFGRARMTFAECLLLLLLICGMSPRSCSSMGRNMGRRLPCASTWVVLYLAASTSVLNSPNTPTPRIPTSLNHICSSSLLVADVREYHIIIIIYFFD